MSRSAATPLITCGVWATKAFLLMRQLIRWPVLALIFAPFYNGSLLGTHALLFIRIGLLNRIMPGVRLIMLPDFLTSILTGPYIVGSLLEPWTLHWLDGALGLNTDSIE